MSKLTKEEVSMWIRNLVPYLENPAILAPKGLFGKGEVQLYPGAIIEYGDELSPAYTLNQINQTENIKALVELYKSVDKEDK